MTDNTWEIKDSSARPKNSAEPYSAEDLRDYFEPANAREARLLATIEEKEEDLQECVEALDELMSAPRAPGYPGTGSYALSTAAWKRAGEVLARLHPLVEEKR